MFVDVLGENVGDTLTLLLPLKDILRKVVFMEVAGEDIRMDCSVSSTKPLWKM